MRYGRRKITTGAHSDEVLSVFEGLLSVRRAMML